MPLVQSPLRGSVTRRSLLRLSAGAVATGGVSGHALRFARPARPSAHGGVVTLHFQINNQGAPWDTTSVDLVQQFVDDSFNGANPGIRAIVDPSGWGNLSGQIAASVAGSGYNDVLESCCDDFASLIQSGWAVPLNAYLQRDNIPTSIWSAAHVAALNVDGQQLGLPSYDGPAVAAYRQDFLDDRGLPYPSPDWTYTEAQSLCGTCQAV